MLFYSTWDIPAGVVGPELHHGPHLCPLPVLVHGHAVVPGVVIISPAHCPVTLAVVLTGKNKYVQMYIHTINLNAPIYVTASTHITNSNDLGPEVH